MADHMGTATPFGAEISRRQFRFLAAETRDDGRAIRDWTLVEEFMVRQPTGHVVERLGENMGDIAQL
ncbi:MAG: hypothetical protein O6934_08030, partial [SAR324 cluster bacterium]|nr:hypothetical protein [SAR324 cluster bacterium]